MCNDVQSSGAGALQAVAWHARLASLHMHVAVVTVIIIVIVVVMIMIMTMKPPYVCSVLLTTTY